MSPFHSHLGSHTFPTLRPVYILPQMQIEIYLQSFAENEVIKEKLLILIMCQLQRRKKRNVPSLLSFRGSSIAKIIGNNVKASNRFDPMVNMWVYEEIIQGRKLTEIINTEHENVKYLPGHKLPKNVVSVQVFPAPADLVLFNL